MNKTLNDLLYGLGQIEIKGNTDLPIKGLTQDSRKVKDGYVFIAIQGSAADGHAYIERAIKAGAVVICCQEWPDEQKEGVVYVRHPDTRMLLAHLAANYFDHPSKEMQVIGVTGTNGKTTVATMLYNLFKELGYKVGLISTIEMRIGEKKLNASLTTPDTLTLQAIFRQMSDSGCQYVFMEVSSHALDQKRVAGIEFAIAVFTNVTHDHLDYHGSFKAYIKAKKLFFDELGPKAYALINRDDKNGRVMVQNCTATIRNYGLRQMADFKGKILSQDESGLFLEINGHKIMTRLIGGFNAYNLLAVYGVAHLLNVANEGELLEALSGLGPVKGRFELVSRHPHIVVDYAHTPDALENVLRTFEKMKARGRVFTVVGCGGNRDKAKRPLMGKIAATMSDWAIFTADNPRDEAVRDIISAMGTSLTKPEKEHVLEIEDRVMAIKTAMAMAKQEDMILIAGKGHEDYQEVSGKRIFLSDQQIVKDILSKDI